MSVERLGDRSEFFYLVILLRPGIAVELFLAYYYVLFYSIQYYCVSLHTEDSGSLCIDSCTLTDTNKVDLLCQSKEGGLVSMRSDSLQCSLFFLRVCRFKKVV